MGSEFKQLQGAERARIAPSPAVGKVTTGHGSGASDAGFIPAAEQSCPRSTAEQASIYFITRLRCTLTVFSAMPRWSATSAINSKLIAATMAKKNKPNI